MSVGVHVYVCVPCTCMPTHERGCVCVCACARVCTCTCMCPRTCVCTLLGHACVLGLQWLGVLQALLGVSQAHVPVFLGTRVSLGMAVVHQWVNQVIQGSVSFQPLPTPLRPRPAHMCKCEHPRECVLCTCDWCVHTCICV